jgi:hypothetical protein
MRQVPMLELTTELPKEGKQCQETVARCSSSARACHQKQRKSTTAGTTTCTFETCSRYTGVLTARRYVSLLDEPKYAAVYELESADVLQSEAYLTIPNGRRDGGLPSRWGDDLTGYTRQQYRLLFDAEK